MKKIYLIGLAAAAMLSACNQDKTLEKTQNTKAIGFSTFVGKSTRGADISTANLGNFSLYGWMGTAQIFDNQMVAGDGTYSPLQYWTSDQVYKFEAVYPQVVEGGSVSMEAAKNGGTITFTNDTETDLLYAKSATVNSTATADVEGMPKVGLTFKHLLSRVKFTFKNAFPENSPVTINVTDVALADAYKSGSVTPNAGTTWTTTTEKLPAIDFAENANLNGIVAGTGNGDTDHKYLIPAQGAKYTLTFTVEFIQNGVSKFYNHSVEITDNMLMGKSYNYTASLDATNINPDTQLKPIEFQPTVEEWEGFGEVVIPEE